ncbi:MAG: hypothetical protein JXO51_05315 [Candidatus Aminicenantes bacterium]|nr:hypothetical protein [Candidatus Aminicenantes bacterium]
MTDNRMGNQDDLVRRLVQSLDREIPAATEERLDLWLKRAAAAGTPRRRRLILSLTTVAVLALLVLSLGPLRSWRREAAGLPRPPAPSGEVKMEVELRNKNIKIIWFRKEGFNLRKG